MGLITILSLLYNPLAIPSNKFSAASASRGTAITEDRLPSFCSIVGLGHSCYDPNGTFLVATFHLVMPCVLFLDYMGIATWYWWLTGQTTSDSSTRLQMRYASCYISVMTLILAVIAAFGTVWGSLLLLQEVLYSSSHIRPSFSTHTNGSRPSFWSSLPV